MKYNLTREQFLTYIYGPEKAQEIQENPEKNHYVKAFEKLQNGKKFVWNWSAFFASHAWAVYRRMPHIGGLAMVYMFLISILMSAIFISAILMGTGIVNGVVTVERMISIMTIAIAIPYYTIFGGFGDHFLIKHIAKQVNKGNICPFPNGGSLTLAILSVIFPLFILIAILRNKYVISRYRKAKKQES